MARRHTHPTPAPSGLQDLTRLRSQALESELARRSRPRRLRILAKPGCSLAGAEIGRLRPW